MSSTDGNYNCRSTHQAPGNAQRPSHLCPPHIRLCFPCINWALEIFAPSPSISASYVIPVRQASALLSASFRFYLTIDTLAVQLMIPHTGLIEDFHLRVFAPCRAQSSRRQMIISFAVLSHHRTYRSVYGGSIKLMH